jgi:hypothetical protein
MEPENAMELSLLIVPVTNVQSLQKLVKKEIRPFYDDGIMGVNLQPV